MGTKDEGALNVEEVLKGRGLGPGPRGAPQGLLGGGTPGIPSKDAPLQAWRFFLPPPSHALRAHGGGGVPEEWRAPWRAEGSARRVERAPEGSGGPSRLPGAKCKWRLRGFP